MIIKLYDSDDDYSYPLIEIKDNYLTEFKNTLDMYRHNNDDYNLDDFLDALEDKDWFVRGIYCDEQVYF